MVGIQGTCIWHFLGPYWCGCKPAHDCSRACRAPECEFEELCDLILRRLHEMQMLVIVDDVCKEDFKCFRKGLALLMMRSGSCCVMTSRHSDLVSLCRPHKDVMLTHDTNRPNAVPILSAYAGFKPEDKPAEDVMVRLRRRLVSSFSLRCCSISFEVAGTEGRGMG